MRREVTAFAFAVVLALSGCGSKSQTIGTKNMDRLVLKQQDLGSPFTSFSSGPQTRLDNQGTPRADATRDGREGGWIARFHRPGSAATQGPLVVESRADVFKAESGAKKRASTHTGRRWRPLPVRMGCRRRRSATRRSR